MNKFMDELLALVNKHLKLNKNPAHISGAMTNVVAYLSASVTTRDADYEKMRDENMERLENAMKLAHVSELQAIDKEYRSRTQEPPK